MLDNVMPVRGDVQVITSIYTYLIGVHFDQYDLRKK